MIEGARRKYEAALSGIAAAGKGGRHNKLFPAAVLGVYARISQEQIVEDIFGAGGYREIERGEIRHAVRDAVRRATVYDVDGSASGGNWVRRFPKAERAPKTLRQHCEDEARKATPGERGFVRSMIAAGSGRPTPSPSATVDGLERDGYGIRAADFVRVSPQRIPDTPAEQAAAQILLIGADWRWKVWAGHGYQARNAAAVRYADEWADYLRHGGEIPPLVCANQVSGLPSGGGSFRCDETVAAFRHVRIEFDELPLPLQAAFWLGVWRSRSLPLRCVTFSGGKSLHALLRIEECPDRVPGANGGHPVRETANAADLDFYRRQWGALARALATDPDAALRCDINAPNPSSMIRLGGHLRTEYKGGRHAPTWQRLLFMLPPDMENDQIF